MSEQQPDLFDLAFDRDRKELCEELMSRGAWFSRLIGLNQWILPNGSTVGEEEAFLWLQNERRSDREPKDGVRPV